jgi:hypothetical protein
MGFFAGPMKAKIAGMFGGMNGAGARPMNPRMPAGIGQRLQAARAQRSALASGAGAPSGGFRATALKAAQAAQASRGAMRPPPVAGGGGGMAPQGKIAGYADGGKVVSRKPNGKAC